jgi:hydrogenase maturation protein HypF
MNERRRNKVTGERNDAVMRLELRLVGLVQGVGFRPFVYRLATELGLAGWVCNSSRGVEIEVEGPVYRLQEFVARLETEQPVHARIESKETRYWEASGYTDFVVRESDDTGERQAWVMPDMASCPDCLRELFDPHDRRYRYPFTNCTNCGPRYSIIESLPYDRPNTTMKLFEMCPTCRSEYDDPRNRRFHAQPNACPVCGPQLELWDGGGIILLSRDDALRAAGEGLRQGRILALKGLGGFQLLVDARNQQAVERLRLRKAREEKPLALMYPNLSAIDCDCAVSEIERRTLLSPQSPIVLLKRRFDTTYPQGDMIAAAVAPQNPYLGVMLPYTPLHHLLMRDLGFAVVATSGNLSDEPICIDEREAVERLGVIADLFLVHNRPIARQMDDSVVQVVHGRLQVLRNARGYAPTPVVLKTRMSATLAVGPHLKNSLAVASGTMAFLGQHIGDLDTVRAYDALGRTAQSLTSLYQLHPERALCDLHPDYASTAFAQTLHLPLTKVQHHYAHVLAGMADNELEAPVLGVSWDGTGYGADGTIWGGEFLLVDEYSFTRLGNLRTFRLPGGEKAVIEAGRSAIGLLYELFGERAFAMMHLSPLKRFSTGDRTILAQMLAQNINCPTTSSAGRLFDAVASLLDIEHVNIYNGQAAMKLGFAAEQAQTDVSYPFDIRTGIRPYIIDWEAMIRGILDELRQGMDVNAIAAKFHNTLAEMIVAMADAGGRDRIVLTGGCFQNRYLTERVITALEKAGFSPYWHHRIPPNDGGVAMGQILACARRNEE